MNSKLLISVLLSALSLMAAAETVEYSFESHKIKQIKTASGTCEVKSVDLSYCELKNLKTGMIEQTVKGQDCEQDANLNKKIAGKGSRKFEINKTVKIKTTAIKTMNLMIEFDGAQTVIPFYSNQEDPKVATNSCDFPKTTEDKALVDERAKSVFKALALARTVYRNQFDQCYTQNSTFEIRLLSGLPGNAPNKLLASSGTPINNKLVDCASSTSTPILLNHNEESCLVLKTEQSVRANCITTADDIPERFADAGNCLDDLISSATKELVFKGYEKVTERWYVKKAKPLTE